VPLTSKSRRVTAFCTPFGLFEYEKLQMGISVGCQGISFVVDNLFSALKGKYMFNYLDDLLIYSATVTEHKEHFREVLNRLQTAGFTLNKEKVVLGAGEIKYLGHYLSARGVRVIPDRVEVIKQFPRPRNL